MAISTRIGSLLLLLASILASTPAFAQDTTLNTAVQRTVSVQGEGILTVPPDHAIVRFGVVSTHEDPEEARAANATASRRAMDEIRGLGVEERLIRLENLSLQPERVYDPQRRTWEHVGFEAVRQVRVTVEDLDLLPVIVTRVVQSGANRLNGITYDIKDREFTRQEALQIAARNARAKAVLLAQTLGAEIGSVLQINEEGIHIPRPNLVMNEMVTVRADMAAPPEPGAYASGEIEVRATVGVVFALK